MSTQIPETLPAILLALVDRPGEAFRAIAARARRLWLVPFAFLVVVMLASTFITADHYARLQAEISRYWIEHGRFAEQMPPDAREQALEQIERQAERGASSSLLALSIGGGVVGTVLGWLIWGAVLHYAATLQGSETSRFDAMFNVAAWAWIPHGLGQLVKAGFTLFSGRLPLYDGLSFLVATGNYPLDSMNPLFQFLSGLTLWQLASWWLLVAGASAVSGQSRRRWAGLVLGVWLLFAFLKLVPLLVQRRFMGI